MHSKLNSVVLTLILVLVWYGLWTQVLQYLSRSETCENEIRENEIMGELVKFQNEIRNNRNAIQCTNEMWEKWNVRTKHRRIESQGIWNVIQ